MTGTVQFPGGFADEHKRVNQGEILTDHFILKNFRCDTIGQYRDFLI